MDKSELQLILQEGEGYKIEFKESLAHIDRELAAFANSSGGRILLGVTDDGSVRGINVDNKLKSQIQDIANNLQPAVKILLEELENILVIFVKEGHDKPHKCSSGFYTRVGPNSQKLSRNEIIEFFKAEGKVRFDELVNPKFDYDTHFDQRKLDKFLRLAGISKVLDAPSILTNLGAVEKQEGKIVFNNTGILFFPKNLADTYFHTAVTCALYKGVEKVDVLDRRDFNEDIVGSIDGAMNFLKQYIPVRYEMTGAPRRREIPEVPYDALREALINAVVHRDYFEKGANVMVEMFDDRIEITNPGGLVKSLRPEDFGKKSALRNPNIANLLHRIEYIEKMGTGISKIRKLMKEAKLSPPKFEFNTFFTVTFKRPIAKRDDLTKVEFEPLGEALYEAIRETANETVNETVKNRLIRELSVFYEKGSISLSSIQKQFSISRASAHRDIAYLRKIGFIQFEGAPKTGRHVLTEKGKQLIERKIK
jgi:ATP-dependent DNA helicase RecG